MFPYKIRVFQQLFGSLSKNRDLSRSALENSRKTVFAMCSCLIQNFFRRVAGFEVRVLREFGLCDLNTFLAAASALC